MAIRSKRALGANNIGSNKGHVANAGERGVIFQKASDGATDSQRWTAKSGDTLLNSGTGDCGMEYGVPAIHGAVSGDFHFEAFAEGAGDLLQR